MVYRYSWLAGLGSLLFAFYGLTLLLRSTVEGPPWQFIVLAGLALGVIITWTALSYRINIWLVGGLNLIAMIVAVGRVAAPETTTALLPTTSTFDELSVQWERAYSIIRGGIEPVIPESGIVVVLMLLFWVVGSLLAWGLTTGHPYVALLPPLVLSLQFATMDRKSTGWLLVAVFIVLVGGMILAVTTDERDQTAGRMARRGEWPSSRSKLAPAATALLAVTLVAAAGSVTLFQDRVPESGVLDWRQSSGLGGDFTGSGSFNPFIGIKQSLVNNSDDTVFLARITGDVPADQVYFRLLTMETYNGGQFFADKPQVDKLEELPWEAPGLAFAGETKTVTTDIQIEALRMDWLPAAYTPIDVAGENSLLRSLRVRGLDGSLRLDGGRSFRAMQYSVESSIPQPDLNVLALNEAGFLSASFAKALDEGEEVPEIVTLDALTQLTRDRPPDAERYLDLPTDDPDARIEDIATLAADQTKNLETDFEKALALESWFHSSAFGYTTNIDPGHGATDLAEWLLVPGSPNYRLGYCENFATAMAIMARTLDIPSRVVLGFTPGRRSVEQENVVIVKGRNSHAWVELWMPSQGWVRFDPTPRLERDTPQTFEAVGDELGYSFTAFLDIPDPEVLDFENGPNIPPVFAEDFLLDRFIGGGGGDFGQGDNGFPLPGWLRITLPVLLGLALVFGAIPAAKWVGRRRRMRRLREGDVTAAWEEIVTRLTDLNESPEPTMTPDEYAAEVDVAMAPLATIYGRTLYGPADGIEDHHVATATRALATTKDRLVTRHSRGRRLAALYRPGTILPRWMRRKNGKGKS